MSTFGTSLRLSTRHHSLAIIVAISYMSEHTLLRTITGCAVQPTCTLHFFHHTIFLTVQCLVSFPIIFSNIIAIYPCFWCEISHYRVGETEGYSKGRRTAHGHCENFSASFRYLSPFPELGTMSHFLKLRKLKNIYIYFCGSYFIIMVS